MLTVIGEGNGDMKQPVSDLKNIIKYEINKQTKKITKPQDLEV